MVDPPDFDDPARVVQAGEQELVQAVVTQAAEEILDEAVLLQEDDSDGAGDGSSRTGFFRLPFRELRPYDQGAWERDLGRRVRLVFEEIGQV